MDFQKPSVYDSRVETPFKRNSMKRRLICGNDSNKTGAFGSSSHDKKRKKRKEPRPHPSYRLNKRYWDDIRAGRRSHDAIASPSSARIPSNSPTSPQSNSPKNQPKSKPIPSAIAPSSSMSFTSIPTQMALSFPLIGTYATPSAAFLQPTQPPSNFDNAHCLIPQLPSCSFASFPSNHVMLSSPTVSGLRNGVEPKFEPDDTQIDVISYDEHNITSTPNTSATIQHPLEFITESTSLNLLTDDMLQTKQHRKLSPAALSSSSKSDQIVDEIADQILIDKINESKYLTGKGDLRMRNADQLKQNDISKITSIIPIPFPVPILVPLSETFILKYFKRVI
ncbi:unnamed protein product [Anisakis simplex]|uniref:Uncharacterized protein n=1 Tax=Anisakis simplex TaxID=6269 RepID=A0A0M3JRT8_ANISI|nr:unnamed protein product [Anisakis simplex]